MRVLPLRPGPVEQWGPSFPLPRSSRGPPLLSLALPLHQDPLGADVKLVDFWPFLEAIVEEIWGNQHSERGGRWGRVSEFH
jgi:hypothetical protein